MRSRLPRLAAALLLVAALGCAESVSGPPEPDGRSVIERFLAKQSLRDMQEPRITTLSSEAGVDFFTVKYGPPNDCPSGCFFFTAYGLRYGDEVGWLEIDPGDEVVQAHRDYFFDFDPGDAPLFDPDVFSKIESKRRAANDHAFRYVYPQALAEDTPHDTLLWLVENIPSANLIISLIDHPTAVQSREILTSILALPSSVDTQHVHERARELLDQLNR